jgi:hypothetical protein
MADKTLTRFRRVLAPMTAAALLALLAPAAAPAETFCVNVDAGACLLGTHKPTVQDALTAAEDNGTEDLVRIGPKATPYDEGSLVYVSPEKVTVVGAGEEETVLTGDGGLQYPALTVHGPGSEISNLGVKVPDATAPTGLYTDAEVRSVRIIYTGHHAGAKGIYSLGGGLVADTVISMSDGAGVYANTGEVAVRDSSISAPSAVYIAGDGVSGRLSRLRIHASGRAVTAANASIEAENLQVESDGGSAISALGSAQVHVSHATLVGHNGDIGVEVSTPAGTAGMLELSDSVISGYQHSLSQLGVGAITARYSSFATTGVVSQGPGSVSIAGNGNVTDVDPGFAAPDGLVPDYRPAAGSPLVDAADPQDPLTTDINRNGRPADGDGADGPRSDIGAHERAAAPVPGGGGGGTPGGGDPAPGGDPTPGGAGPAADRTPPLLSRLVVTPRFRLGARLARLSARPVPGSFLRFRLSEAARVTLRFARLRRGRYVTVPGAVALSARAGLNRVRFQGRLSRRRSLRPGRYRVTVAAVDAAGNRARARTARFTLLARRG